MTINEKTIWCSKQNHPELVVQDCRKEFGLDVKQCEKLRFILMNRGVNKWLYARIRFISLKHDVKKMMKSAVSVYSHNHPLVKDIKQIQETMQNIAKMPRWVEWGTHRHKHMKKNQEAIVVKGKSC